MTRSRTMMFLAALALAVTALVRSRSGEPQAVDRGGWEPVDPGR